MRAFWNKNLKPGTINKTYSTDQTVESVIKTASAIKLNHEDLCSKFDPDNLQFSTTADIETFNDSIAQQRALDALDFGLKIKSNGFNIFVSGLTGTGKDSCIMQKLEIVAKSEPVPDDICYVYNSKNPQSPRALFFPAGSSKSFKSELQMMIKNACTRIKDAFCSEMYENQSNIIDIRYEREKEKLESELNRFAQSHQCVIKQNYKRKTVQLYIDGKATKDSEIECMVDNKRKQYLEAIEEVNQKIFQTERKIRIMKKQIDSEIGQSDQKIVSDIVESTISEINKKFLNIDGLNDYLVDIRDLFIRDFKFFKQDDSPEDLFLLFISENSGLFEINILVDNSSVEGAPVITEKCPSYENLFGSIEYKYHNGAVVADHLSLQAGSVHRARGGYLIMEVEEILGDLHAWDALKKLLRHGVAKIENISERSAVFPLVVLRPEPLNVDLKVILTGDPTFYQSLYNNDDEFLKVFKVKADFDEYLSKNDKNIDSLIAVLARVSNLENLRHCDRTGAAGIIDYSSRLTEHKKRLSARLSKILDLLREANFIASGKNSSFISSEHIKSACKAFKKRCDTLEENYFSLFDDNTINIETQGMRLGQINGVSTINNGENLFGVPSRITARAFIGSGNIINIEREIEMSGKIHTKGVLILSGYFGQTYAQDKPLALSASICFEQHYEEIDGDSASSAELYCLMSILSGVPLRQDVAVTGSVDQRGMILPVGGINAKIEGFFRICKIKGLSGTQGVIIPVQNVQNLMLDDEIIDAVRQNLFHVYAVNTIEQGLQILTGRDPGYISEDGSFQQNTIHFLVNQKLREYASVLAIFEKENNLD